MVFTSCPQQKTAGKPRCPQPRSPQARPGVFPNPSTACAQAVRSCPQVRPSWPQESHNFANNLIVWWSWQSELGTTRGKTVDGGVHNCGQLWTNRDEPEVVHWSAKPSTDRSQGRSTRHHAAGAAKTALVPSFHRTYYYYGLFFFLKKREKKKKGRWTSGELDHAASRRPAANARPRMRTAQRTLYGGTPSDGRGPRCATAVVRRPAPTRCPNRQPATGHQERRTPAPRARHDDVPTPAPLASPSPRAFRLGNRSPAAVWRLKPKGHP